MDSLDRIYIFISHSHKDIDKVRVIRNFLESLNTEPILFFLKSKTDKDEITQLIKDEINARIWFIYCNSKNAEKSHWCQTEREYALSFPKNNILNIDLDSAFEKDGSLSLKTKEDLLNSLDKIKKVSKMYFSCLHKDIALSRKLVSAFSKYNIHLITTEDLLIGDSWQWNIEESIKESEYFVIFFREEKMNCLKKELEIACKYHKKIIPALITNGRWSYNNLPDDIKLYLRTINFFIFDVNNIDKSIDNFVYNVIKLI